MSVVTDKKEEIENSIEDVDTWDLYAVLAASVGAVFMTNGISEFFTFDLSSTLTTEVSIFTFSLATFLYLGAHAFIAVTNQMEASEMFEFRAVSGGSVLVGVVTTLFISQNEYLTGLVDTMTSGAGASLLVALVLTTAAAAFGTQPN